MPPSHFTITGVLFDGLGNAVKDWFQSTDGSIAQKPSALLSLLPISTPLLQPMYQLQFTDGTECKAKLDEEAMISSFYTNKEIYDSMGKEACVTFDVIFGMSGSEACVESFYSIVKSHLQPGGQINKTLVTRAIVDFCIPLPIQCPKTVREIAILYKDGDKSHGLKT